MGKEIRRGRETGSCDFIGELGSIKIMELELNIGLGKFEWDREKKRGWEMERRRKKRGERQRGVTSTV